MSTPEQFRALTIAAALEMWHKHGIKANSSYTPGNMMASARAITGIRFKPREYMAAAHALRDKAMEL